jgi:hypothetical protein
MIMSRETSPNKKQQLFNEKIVEQNMGDIEYDEIAIDLREQDNNSDIE